MYLGIVYLEKVTIKGFENENGSYRCINLKHVLRIGSNCHCPSLSGDILESVTGQQLEGRTIFFGSQTKVFENFLVVYQLKSIAVGIVVVLESNKEVHKCYYKIEKSMAKNYLQCREGKVLKVDVFKHFQGL